MNFMLETPTLEESKIPGFPRLHLNQIRPKHYNLQLESGTPGATQKYFGRDGLILKIRIRTLLGKF